MVYPVSKGHAHVQILVHDNVLKDVDEVIQGVLNYQESQFRMALYSNTPCGWKKCAFFREFLLGARSHGINRTRHQSMHSYQLAMQCDVQK